MANESRTFEFLGKAIKINSHQGILANYSRVFGLTWRSLVPAVIAVGLTIQGTQKDLAANPERLLDFELGFEKYMKSRSDDYINFLNQQLLFTQKVGSYRAKRQLGGFPSKGQRTHSNAANAKRMKGYILALLGPEAK